MSAYNIMPAWKVNSLKARHPGARVSRPAYTEPEAHPMESLPFLCRRVLRIVAMRPNLSHVDLHQAADLGESPKPQADELILCGLIERIGTSNFRYTLTAAGLTCLQRSRAPGDDALAHLAKALFIS